MIVFTHPIHIVDIAQVLWNLVPEIISQGESVAS